MPLILLADMSDIVLIEPIVQDWVAGIPKSVLYQAFIGADFARHLAPVLGRLPSASSGNIQTMLQFTGVGAELIDFALNFSSSHFFQLQNMYDRYRHSNNLIIDRLQVPVYFMGLQLELIFDAPFLNSLFANVVLEIAGTASPNWETLVTFNFLEAPDGMGNWGWADNSPINPGYDG